MAEPSGDIHRYYTEFYDVLARLFPGLRHLHYGLAPRAARSQPGRLWALARLAAGCERLLERLVAEAGLADLPASAAGLDVGCGLGGTCGFLARRLGLAMTGVNINAGQLDLARERAVADGLAGRVRLLEGDARCLPFEDASFDLVTMIEVAFHVREKERLFAEVARVLRPGGTFVLIDQENRDPLEVLGLFFFPARGDYARLGQAAGLRLQREVDLSAELANWLEAYVRLTLPPWSALAQALALARGGPGLLLRYRAGLRYYDRLVRAKLTRQALRISTAYRNGPQALRQQTLECMRSGEAQYLLQHWRRPERRGL